MRKIKSRFIASLVIFTSIISFLPVGFGGQAANAAETNVDATAITVFKAQTATKLAVTQKSDEVIYSYPDAINDELDGFDIAVNDVRKNIDVDLIPEALSGKKNVTGVTEQVVNIKSINGVDISNTTVLGEMGIVVNDIAGNKVGVGAVIGKQLLNLPYGINKIEYEVIVTTVTVTYIPEKKDTAGNITQAEGTTTGTPIVSNDIGNRKLTIEYGTNFALEQISKLQFKSYVGQESDFSADDTISKDKNNQKPFLYYETGKPDANMPLRYSFNVPDSTFKLKYVMNFQKSLTDATIYRNGQEDTQASVTEGVDENGYNVSILEGSLEKMGASALIVIKLKSANSGGAISKSYAIEIKYSTLNADQDYSLKNAGITKYDFNEIDSVEAYIGKKFTVTKDAAGFSVYNGDIYIDPKANLISLDPELILGKDPVAYKVSNNYVNSGSSGTFIENALLKSDGKKYVDFKRGSLSNTLQVDVYSGSAGNITNSTTILARYFLKVNQITTTDSFTTDLTIEKANNSDAIQPYLTQPGVKEDIIDKFTTARRTYDLYYATGSQVKVNFTGTRSSKNEYFKIWTSTDRNSANPKESTASINNKPDSDLKRETSLNVDLDEAEKMVVQAYYDDFQYETDPTTNVKTVKKDANGDPICMSYPLGEKYVFYIPANYHDTTDPSGQNSDNAFLSSLKLSGYTLSDSDGNSGFSSDKLDYTANVAKEDTGAKITAIAEDDNIKSIVATIDGADGTYDLVSGDLSELPLNSSGKTTIKIVVTAQDGTTTKKYTLVVKNNTKGSNVNLKNVILSSGEFTFDPTSDVNKVRVDQNVTSVQVTPIAEDSKATVNVNGQQFTQSPIAVSLKGAQKTDISIQVNSEDGTTSKTYTLEVYRVDVGDWDQNNSGEDNTESDQFYDEYAQCWVDLTKYEQWGSINGKPAYFDKKGRQVKEAWITTGGKLYYLNNLGYRASGWKLEAASGKTYYLDPTTGEMKKQWMNLDNKWYYLGLNGVMQKGWLNLGNKWYYFSPNGQMVVSQTMYIDDEVFRFGQDGAIY